jgi:glucokinase
LDALIGLDVGASHIKASALTLEGKILFEKCIPTGDDGSNSWLQRARDLFQQIRQLCPNDIAVGVAAPGLVAPDASFIAWMPGRLPGLEGLNWREWLGLRTRVPVFNDAQAALLGESWLGAAKGAKNVVLLTLGTGVGGATIVDGHLLRGHLGRAGHLGHVSLNPDGPLDIVNTPGSLEDAMGEHNLAKRSKGQFTTTRELVAAFRNGSKEAAEIWLKSIRALAATVASLVNVLDPEMVVIGGGIADANDALFRPLEVAVDEFEWRPGGARVRILKAALGPNAGAFGAAYGAKLALTKSMR